MVKRGKLKITKRAKKGEVMKRQAGKRTVKVKAKVGTVKKTKRTSLAPEAINEYVSTRAYYIWEELGKPQGQDGEIWKRAERDIRKQLKKS